MRTDRLMFLALTLCFQAFQGLPAWAGLDLDGWFFLGFGPGWFSRIWIVLRFGFFLGSGLVYS